MTHVAEWATGRETGTGTATGAASGGLVSAGGQTPSGVPPGQAGAQAQGAMQGQGMYGAYGMGMGPYGMGMGSFGFGPPLPVSTAGAGQALAAAGMLPPGSFGYGTSSMAPMGQPAAANKSDSTRAQAHY